ncbi:MAG TPA: hypothetical protein DEF30_07915 [Proteiniclasticum sp.]|nr:hypothetical protein [Proteiniclasticum sp.]
MFVACFILAIHGQYGKAMNILSKIQGCMAYVSSEDYNNIILICFRINEKLNDQHKCSKEDSEKSTSK